MEHHFHQTIREVLRMDFSPGRFVWDKACGSAQWASLFREATKSSTARYACADAVLILDSSVRLVLEIEEAGDRGFLPTRIGGKLYMAALSSYYIPSGRAVPVPFGAHVTFVQVLNSDGLKPKSRKPAQYRNIERDTRDRMLPLGSIDEYYLIADYTDAFRFGDAGDRLRRVVKAVVPHQGGGVHA
jgi:hypothetical protein